MKIATLNLNGATIRSINRRPRLPDDLFNINTIKQKLVERTNFGLEKLLEKNDLDIIAIQELINSQEEKNKLKKIIEAKGYRLIIPEISGNTHFTVGFIVKEDIIADGYKLYEGNSLAMNREATLEFEINGVSYSMINLHVNDYDISFLKPEGNVILLGDMNACTEKQSKENIEANKEFLDKILEVKYVELGQDHDYTWKNTKHERKLDHIFVSEKIAESIEVTKYSSAVTKDDSVNFYYDKGKKEGFTDHSMLILDLEI